MPRKTTGRLEKRGANWLAIWTHNGKRYAKSTGTGDRAKAERFLAEQIGDFATENVQEQARRIAARALSDLPSPMIASAWTLFEKAPSRERAGDHQEHYLKSIITRFQNWMEAEYPKALTLREVSDEIAARYWGDIQAAYAPATANHHKKALFRLWTILCDKDPVALARNPWRKANIRPLHVESNSRRELTVEELARVCGSVEGEYRTLFALGIYTGARMGDAVSLDWGAVDLVRGFVSFVPGKTAKHGTRVKVPLAPALRQILERTPAEERKGPILPGLLAIYRKRHQELSRRVQDIFRKAGIETQGEGANGRASILVGFHSLRHTFVSLAANAGVPLSLVKSIVGHTEEKMTEHYFHVEDEALRRAVEPFPDVINPDAEPAKAESGMIQKFRDLLAGMTDAEKAEALAMLKEAVG